MKQYFLLMGIAALIFTACKSNKNDDENYSLRMAEVLEKYNDATTLNDSLLLLMGDIYAGLDAINEQEGLLVNPGVGDNADRREEIQTNLAAIKDRLAANKQLLAELEQKVNQGNEATRQNKILQQTISDLKKRIETQEIKINELNGKLAEANERISELTSEMEVKDEQIKQETQAKDSAVNRANKAEAATEVARQETKAAEAEANKVFYCLGTNKQLKEYGVLEKKFLGATKIMQGDDINYNCFVQADKRNLNKIPTNAKKVSIKSNVPADSYMISGQNDGPKTIVITNPSAFWRNSPYLVVELDDVLK